MHRITQVHQIRFTTDSTRRLLSVNNNNNNNTLQIYTSQSQTVFVSEKKLLFVLFHIYLIITTEDHFYISISWPQKKLKISFSVLFELNGQVMSITNVLVLIDNNSFASKAKMSLKNEVRTMTFLLLWFDQLTLKYFKH